MKNRLHRATNVFINLSLTNLHFSRDFASDSGIFDFINLQKAGPVKSKEKKLVQTMRKFIKDWSRM